ncbi:hypothetical protein VTN00DRAFT_777 [Thermoascus crustaceus]|uniref:uncharacterized protein n=1 Tax=Thermoascus crustaceus TaxID=5088 RepID=UPI0037422E99
MFVAFTTDSAPSEDALAHRLPGTESQAPLTVGEPEQQQNDGTPTHTVAAEPPPTVTDVDNRQIDGGPSESRLLSLPPELIHQILSHLSARDLACASATCHTLFEHGRNDLLWADLVNSNLPFKIQDPGPFDCFRKLYIAHNPFWFLPRNKIWFSDAEHTGNLILTRYDNRRGVIEGYRVVAEKQSHQFQEWEWDPEVIIQTFNPQVRLWLDDPVILLKHSASAPPKRRQYLHGEIRMPMPLEMQHVYNSFSLCARKIPADQEIPPDRQWPPLTIPSSNRVYREMEIHPSEWHQPSQNVDQISESAFRVRRWARFRMGFPIFATGSTETMSTYATLDPKLYTPTREKPYQGIWVGDYSDHGCEFLLFLQRDKEVASGSNSSSRPTTPPTINPASQSSEAETAMELENKDDELIQQGSLEGIKLTGDPNVPRGEISFIAEDIGSAGLVRVADEKPFRGARIVQSKGHVAALGFRDDKFIPSQLILISRDCIAQYWEALDHISYFRRIDIDKLLQT